jgi:DNA-binding response OmpR family regulator
MDYYVLALQYRGFNVQHIDTTDEALGWIDGLVQPPNVLILDLMMPSGSRLTEKETGGGLRTGEFIGRAFRAKFLSVPIIVLTIRRYAEAKMCLPEAGRLLIKYETPPFALADFIGGIV